MSKQVYILTPLPFHKKCNSNPKKTKKGERKKLLPKYIKLTGCKNPIGKKLPSG